MQRITSHSGAIGVNLETLEPRRLLSGTLEAVDLVAPFPIITSPTLVENLTSDPDANQGVYGEGKAILHLKLDLPPKIIDGGGHQLVSGTEPWDGTEALVQQIRFQLEALLPGITVAGGEVYMDNGQFFIELGHMTREAFAEAVAHLGGEVIALPEIRHTGMPNYAWGESIWDFANSTPKPHTGVTSRSAGELFFEQPSMSGSATASQNAEMTRWIVNFERPTFELMPGFGRTVDLDAIHNPKVIIDRDAQIAELGSDIRFVRNMVHQYSILVEAPADMTAEQMTAILSRLDGFKSVAQDQVIVSVYPPGELFSQQPSAGTSPAAGFWNDTPGSSLVDLDDDTDDAILLLTTPEGELLG